MATLAKLLGIRDPQHNVRGWHVSPTVDSLAYAYSWLFVLLPMLAYGPTRKDFIWVYLIIMAATDVHRHYNMPYAYLDRDIRQRYPVRFWVFPLALLAGWGISPWLAKAKPLWQVDQLVGIGCWLICMVQAMASDGRAISSPRRPALARAAWLIPCVTAVASCASAWVDPRGAWPWICISGALCWGFLHATRPQADSAPPLRRKLGFVLLCALAAVATLAAEPESMTIRSKLVLGCIAVFAGLWNFWHVYMQKYGIMRMYAAKAGREYGRSVPGWVDRLFIFAWLPLYVTWLAPQHGPLLLKSFRKAKFAIPSALEFLIAHKAVLATCSLVFLAFAVGNFIRHEWRSHRFSSRPRLVMASGCFLLGASFLVVSPLKAYLAFAFSHGLEYMVFVWAFQRRRYREELPHRPLLGRILQKPWLAYACFTIGLAVTFWYLKYFGRYIFPELERPTAWGYRTAVWMSYWGIYQSLLHFYFDGFMWKIRSAELRSQL